MRYSYLIGLIVIIVVTLSCTPSTPPPATLTPPSSLTPPSMLPPSSTSKPDQVSTPDLMQTKVVMLSLPNSNPGHTFKPDEVNMQPLLKEVGYSYVLMDQTFVNNEAQWFDQNGKRKVDIFIVPGGTNPRMCFEKTAGVGINDIGCQNIRNFISKGGSVICFCQFGTSLFAETDRQTRLTEKWGRGRGQWIPITYTSPGCMVDVYGGEPVFKGKVQGPQESNMPPPRARFLPIKLNMENSIVKGAKLPDIVYLCVLAGPDLIPDPDQPMEVIGWFPDGAAAIAIVKYGDGHLYMISPHADLTMENSLASLKGLITGSEAISSGVNDEQMKEAVSILEKEGDPDGPSPDLILMKAILKDAAARASAVTK